jgi:asparagine synthase (glutamine-hydrolysing)
MALQSSEPVKTFSIGFEEAEFNELEYSSAVARRYNTDHRQIMVKPDAVSLVARLVDHFDEPFADSASIPTLIMSEETVKYVKVALSGDGGDELFGGYDSFFLVDRLRGFDSIPAVARSGVSALASAIPYSARGKNYLRMISRGTPLDRYFELNYAHYFLRKQLLQPAWMLPEGAGHLRSILPDCFIRRDADILSEVMYWEATANLTGDMLVKADRMSMAASLEVRCPLLDHELAELAMRIPHAWKMQNGKGKQILIDSMKDRLPAEILNRKKHGFAVPLAVWFRSSLRAFLRDFVDSKRFFDRGFVSPKFVRYLIDEHEAGRRDNSHWLWALLMLELWARRTEEFQPAVSGSVSCSLSTAN